MLRNLLNSVETPSEVEVSLATLLELDMSNVSLAEYTEQLATRILFAVLRRPAGAVCFRLVAPGASVSGLLAALVRRFYAQGPEMAEVEPQTLNPACRQIQGTAQHAPEALEFDLDAQLLADFNGLMATTLAEAIAEFFMLSAQAPPPEPTALEALLEEMTLQELDWSSSDSQDEQSSIEGSQFE